MHSLNNANGKILLFPRYTLDVFLVLNSTNICRVVLKGRPLCCIVEQMFGVFFFFTFSNLVHLQYQFHTALKSEEEVLQISFFPAVPVVAQI